jgi:hypothetical protein
MVRVLSLTDPHGEERAVARVSNHERNTSLILRDAAKAPLLRMRVLWLQRPAAVDEMRDSGRE